MLKKKATGWKRCRRSLKGQRDEVRFREGQALQVSLHQQEADGKINLSYFDESGFNTTLCIPYAWQVAGETRLLDSKRSKRLNIVGFMSRKNEVFVHPVEHTVTSQNVVAAFDAFAAHHAGEYAQTKIPHFVVLDNASTHRSKVFLARVDDWRKQGIHLHFLPPYGPELNLIEILWRKIKYEWLPLDAYQSYRHMKEAVLDILANVGGKFSITFA